MTVRTVEDRLDTIETKITQLEAKQGTIKLSAPIWSLLITTMLVIWSAAACVVGLQFASNTQGNQLVELKSKVESHISQEGHPVIVDRVKRLQEELQQHIDKTTITKDIK